MSCESNYVCVDGRSRYLYIVLGGYLLILGAPSGQSCCTLSISASYRDITRFYEEQRQPSSGSVWTVGPKNDKSDLRRDNFTAYRLCRLEPSCQDCVMDPQDVPSNLFKCYRFDPSI